MQADPHKLDFRNELLARMPGAGGLGPLGPMGGGLPPSHDLTRPASLFTVAGVCPCVCAHSKVFMGVEGSVCFGLLWGFLFSLHTEYFKVVTYKWEKFLLTLYPPTSCPALLIMCLHLCWLS